MKKKILVVDDDPGVCKFFSVVLEEEGYEITTASTGNEALKALEQSDFPVTVLDIKLPEIGGMELLEKIKKDSPDTQAVMVTGFPSSETAEKSLGESKAKAFAYLTKPMKKDEIKDTVNSAYKKYELKKKHEKFKYKESVYSLIVIDSQGKIKNINKSTEEFLGYEKGQLSDTHMDDVLRGDIDMDFFKKASHMKKFDGLNLQLVDINGENVNVAFNGTVIKDESRGIMNLVGMIKKV